jgi:hypothetical protein
MTAVRIAISAAIAAAALSPVSAPAATSKTIFASLSGKQEVPTKGDPDGTATATITFSASRTMCYVIKPKKMESKIAAAHIHTGKRGKAGGILVDLFTSPKTTKNGRLSGCATRVSKATIDKIFKAPSGFYVNLHTARYPSGAARGQITRMP